MTEKRGDYTVGYGRPPAASRFKKGTSGNPKGRPKKRAGPTHALAEIIGAPVKIRRQGKSQTIPITEALLLRQLKLALEEDDKSALVLLLKIFEQHGHFDATKQKRHIKIDVPLSWYFHDWMRNYFKYGLPPWPGERSGFAEEWELGFKGVDTKTPAVDLTTLRGTPRHVAAIASRVYVTKVDNRRVARTTLELLFEKLREHALSGTAKDVERLMRYLKKYDDLSRDSVVVTIAFPAPPANEKMRLIARQRMANYQQALIAAVGSGRPFDPGYLHREAFNAYPYPSSK